MYKVPAWEKIPRFNPQSRQESSNLIRLIRSSVGQVPDGTWKLETKSWNEFKFILAIWIFTVIVYCKIIDIYDQHTYLYLYVENYLNIRLQIPKKTETLYM